MTFPADYHGKDVAGKQAEFTLTVHSVAAPELPPVDAEFARAFGVASGDLEDLRDEITANLQLELRRKIDARVKEQAIGALREQRRGRRCPGRWSSRRPRTWRSGWRRTCSSRE